MSSDKTPAAPTKSGGGIFKLLTVILLPFALFGGFKSTFVFDNVNDEIKSGTKWADVWKQVKEGKTDLLQNMVKDNPEQGASMIIMSGASQDEAFRDAIKANIVRLQKEKKINQLQARTVMQSMDKLGEAPAKDK